MQGWERGESSARRASFSSKSDDKMLNVDHLDLNSVQFCSESVRERLKQTMLNQELELKGQIGELHRVYKVQIAMTEDAKKRGLDEHNSHAVGKSSPVNLNNLVNCSLSVVQRCIPELNQKMRDLHLSADDFILLSGESSRNMAVGGFPIESNNSSKSTVGFDLHRMLNIAEDPDRRAVFQPPPENIDLEDANSIDSKNDANLGLPSGLSSQNSCVEDKHKSETLILGFGGNSSVSDTSVPPGKFKFDLNTVPTEDLSYDSYISNTRSRVVHHVSTDISTSTAKSCSNVNSCTVVPDNVKPEKARNEMDTTWAKVDRGGKFEGNNSKIAFIDLDPDSDEELCGSDGPKIESVGSISKLSNDRSCEIDVAKAVVEAKPVMLSHSGVQGQRSSESPDSNIHVINGKEVESDPAVITAAEIIMELSLDDKPQWSAETYAAMVQKEKECGPDDYRVSANSVAVDVTEKKDSRYKRKSLKAQMDIIKNQIASSSTLSRREIREDFKAFKVPIPQNRRRKKNGVVIEGDWCKQTRSKRPRTSRKSYLPS